MTVPCIKQVRTAHAAAAARGLVEDGLEQALAGLAPDALQAALASKAAALQARAAALPDARHVKQARHAFTTPGAEGPQSAFGSLLSLFVQVEVPAVLLQKC